MALKPHLTLERGGHDFGDDSVSDMVSKSSMREQKILSSLASLARIRPMPFLASVLRGEIVFCASAKKFSPLRFARSGTIPAIFAVHEVAPTEFAFKNRLTKNKLWEEGVSDIFPDS